MCSCVKKERGRERGRERERDEEKEMERYMNESCCTYEDAMFRMEIIMYVS